MMNLSNGFHSIRYFVVQSLLVSAMQSKFVRHPLLWKVISIQALKVRLPFPWSVVPHQFATTMHEFPHIYYPSLYHSTASLI